MPIKARAMDPHLSADHRGRILRALTPSIGPPSCPPDAQTLSDTSRYLYGPPPMQSNIDTVHPIRPDTNTVYFRKSPNTDTVHIRDILLLIWLMTDTVHFDTPRYRYSPYPIHPNTDTVHVDTSRYLYSPYPIQPNTVIRFMSIRPATDTVPIRYIPIP
ncbi:hypothetical protein MAR_016708 [Mya arenaria]|uniref:Uncharacterized protein n=1 Tax=Mya arenaria TaxID=6604 RepID=A0ABY7EA84_MYAAR|nr:hypothetical protein MAR_016708 [Mya arenaria]